MRSGTELSQFLRIFLPTLLREIEYILTELRLFEAMFCIVE